MQGADSVRRESRAGLVERARPHRANSVTCRGNARSKQVVVVRDQACAFAREREESLENQGNSARIRFRKAP